MTVGPVSNSRVSTALASMGGAVVGPEKGKVEGGQSDDLDHQDDGDLTPQAGLRVWISVGHPDPEALGRPSPFLPCPRMIAQNRARFQLFRCRTEPLHPMFKKN